MFDRNFHTVYALTMFDRLFETFAFFRTFIFDIARFLVPVALPVVLLEIYLSSRAMEAENAGLIHWVPFMINFVYRPVYTGGLIWVISCIVGGDAWSVRQGFMEGLRYWKDLLVVYIVSSVMIFAGLLALVVPGLLLFARLSLAEFGVVLEGMNPKQALFASNQRVRGFTGEVLACGLTLSFMILALDILMGYFAARMGLQGFLTAVASALIFIVLSSTVTILFYRFYDLALKREGEGPAPVRIED
ncbi:MAG: hypothetical protein ACLFUE_02765 [Desulfobacteraceae bacterium]